MTPNNNTHLNNSTEFDTTDIDFNDQAVDFSSFAVPTAGETASIVGEQVAQKTGKAARTALLVTTLIAGGAALVSCGGDDPINPGGEVVTIDRKTDNPAHKADFMKDVKPAVLAGGTATLNFEAVWTGTGYKLKPIPVIDFTKAKAALEADAAKLNLPLDKMGFGFFVAQSGGAGGIAYAIPYSHIASLEGNQTMKFEDFKQFIVSNSEAKPNVSFSKKEIGYLEIGTGDFYRLDVPDALRIQTELQIINPYYFGN